MSCISLEFPCTTAPGRCRQRATWKGSLEWTSRRLLWNLVGEGVALEIQLAACSHGRCPKTASGAGHADIERANYRRTELETVAGHLLHIIQVYVGSAFELAEIWATTSEKHAPGDSREVPAQASLSVSPGCSNARSSGSRPPPIGGEQRMGKGSGGSGNHVSSTPATQTPRGREPSSG